MKKGNKDMLALVTRGASLITPQEEQALRDKWITPLEPKEPFSWVVVWLLLGITATLSALGFLWVHSLRSRVIARTKELLDTQAALSARVKQQTCLYSVFKVTESPENNLSDVLQSVVQILPSGFGRSENMVASIRIDGKTKACGEGTQAKCQVSAPVVVDGVLRGELIVGCTEPLSAIDADGFSLDEETMLGTIARRIAEVLQRREVNAAARRREGIYRAIVDQANDSMGVVDASNGRFIEFNDAACQNLGYTREEFESLRVQDIDVLMNAAEIERAFEDLAEAGGAVIESVHQTRSGEHRDVRISNRHLILDGRPLFVSIWSDITDAKRQQRELLAYRDHLAALVSERTAELQAILDGASVGIFRMEGRTVLRCNRTLEDILGYSNEEIVGQTTRAWYPDEASYIEVGEAINEQLATRRYFVAERQLRRKDGQFIWAKIAARPIDSDHPEKGLTSMVEDISAERMALEQIRQARDIAERATRTKSEFLANMSHEIRTPMNAIIGMSYLALKTDLNERQRDYIEKVHRSSQHLLGIINDILDFSKMEAGKLKTEYMPFRLDEVIDNVIGMLGSRADEKGLELILDASAELPLALIGDPLRLNQIILNLMNNAIKFTSAGEVVLSITEVGRRDGRVEIMFAVRDTGVGMTQEQKERLFTPFEQGDSSTTRKYGGTGLGLVIAKGLVDMMEGLFEVKTEPDAGSTFRFHVWFGLQEKDSYLPSRMLTAAELRGVRTMVVDDNEAARDVLSEMSRSFGLDTQAAGSGSEALAILEEAARNARPFQLLLTDWNMPLMDGVELIDRAKRLVGSPDVAVVMVTAYAREDVLRRALSLGIEIPWLIYKPVTPSNLLEVIGSALHQPLRSDIMARKTWAPNEANLDVLEGRRVLLVEDNELNQELATELLEDVGIEVVLAIQGREALDILSKDSSFDAVLMDCQMPVMDGYEATRRIRNELGLSDLTVIAMTANAMTGDREKVLAAGMDDHITKPLDVQYMYETLCHWMTKHPKAVRREALTKDRRLPVVSEPENSLSHFGDWRATAQARTTHVQDTGAGQMMTLPGVDTTAGLKTTNGNLSLYRRLLQRFCEAGARFENEFSLTRERGDLVASIRMAHTLKGTAANLGAFPLKDAAAILEAVLEGSAIKNAESSDYEASLGAALSATLHELHTVLSGLRQHGFWTSAPVDDTATAIHHDSEALVMVHLETLKEMLNRGDPDCREYWQRHHEAFLSLVPSAYRRIEVALNEFNFEAALSDLNHLGPSHEPEE